MNKDLLIEKLKNGTVLLAFVKRDGSNRIMRATLSDAIIPHQTRDSGSNKASEKKSNPAVIPLWDIEAEGWRSVRVDSLLSVDGFSVEVTNAESSPP